MSAASPTSSDPVVGDGELSGRAIAVVGSDASASAIRELLAAKGARLPSWPLDDPRAGLDGLVFIAPTLAVRSIAETSAAALGEDLGAGLGEAFASLQAAVAAMRVKAGGGAVVFVAPPAPGQRAYDAFQSGLRLMVKAAALELGPEHIRVNVVLPGGGSGAAAPLGRRCAPNDVAQAVAFAASDRAKFMTGADLVVDGGRMLT